MWVFLEANSDEREWFPDVAQTAAQAGDLVQEPNAQREVRTVERDGNTYYLKVFHRTSWKNRLRNWTTRPAALLDGEREARVTDGLRALQILAPRPVAWGRSGGRSYYLCAGLDGTPVRELIGDRGASLASAVARYCGKLLRDGIDAPDLSADHVFEQSDGSFGILDLTNVTLRKRPARWRTARRALRRFRRSLREVPLSRELALGFTVRFLRTAGLDRPDRRRMIAGLPQWNTHGRYEFAGKSNDYRQRNPARTEAELKLLRAIWPGVPGESVLDSPCGAGRLAPTLTELGARWIGADRAGAMLAECRSHQDGPVFQADAARLPLDAGATDGVVVFRFLHHLPPDHARAVIGEAARTARRFAVISFFHPISAHGISRRIRGLLQGRSTQRFAITLGTLRRWFGEYGFELHRHTAQSAFRRDLWVASFVRSQASPSQTKAEGPPDRG